MKDSSTPPTFSTGLMMEPNLVWWRTSWATSIKSFVLSGRNGRAGRGGRSWSNTDAAKKLFKIQFQRKDAKPLWKGTMRGMERILSDWSLCIINTHRRKGKLMKKLIRVKFFITIFIFLIFNNIYIFVNRDINYFQTSPNLFWCDVIYLNFLSGIRKNESIK